MSKKQRKSSRARMLGRRNGMAKAGPRHRSKAKAIMRSMRRSGGRGE